MSTEFVNEHDTLDNKVVDEYERTSHEMCDKIREHVNLCKTCQRRLSFDPIEKALLKTHSVKNEVMELVAFVCLGIGIISTIYMLKQTRT
jgi:hypothetical protein